MHKRKHFEVLAKIRTGNWWFYILLGFSEAMGIDLEQQLGQAFLLFPRNVKTFFENSSLTREKEEAALPASLDFVCSIPTHRHTANLGLAASPWLGLCTHTDSSCLSSLCHAPARAMSCRLPQGASLDFCLGPDVLAGTGPWFQAR